MMKNLIKNKRGDIPITILVIGVLAICALTIFSFYTSFQKVKLGLNSFKAVEKAATTADKILLYEELGFSDAETRELLGIRSDESGRDFIEVTTEKISVMYFIPR